MTRNVILMNFIPDYLKNCIEMKAIQEAIQPEIQNMEDETEHLLRNTFILTSDEKGIKKYENMLGTQALDNDTLDNRQFRVLSKWNRYVPYTKTTLRKKLETLCGEDGFTLEIIPAEKRLIVRVSLRSRKNYDEVDRLLEEIVPQDMIIDLSLLYNKYSFMRKMPHFRLAEYTHYQIRNEIFEFIENAIIHKMTHRQLKEYSQNRIRKGII